MQEILYTIIISPACSRSKSRLSDIDDNPRTNGASKIEGVGC